MAACKLLISLSIRFIMRLPWRAHVSNVGNLFRDMVLYRVSLKLVARFIGIIILLGRPREHRQYLARLPQ